jgi:glycosyltransferase involved in cell wall biosynthesis
MDKAADRKAVVTADEVACNSHYTRDYIKRVYGIGATTTYLGVDHDVFAPGPEGEKEDMVVSVGALYPLKAHDFIIRSLARIEGARRPRLVLVGNGIQRKDLETLASSSGVRVEVVSEIDTPRLADLYRRAKLTVIAHIREPFGLVAIESQSCGTPVVAVGEAGLLETVTEETGILTKRDETEFAQAVGDLLKDDERRTEMGVMGRARTAFRR